jgi:RNase H-fold protein (predicted Holliday junction resolvase)
MPRQILAIDPGRAKCGVAIVEDNFDVLHRAIVPTTGLIDSLPELCHRFEPEAVVLGDGTGSLAVQETVNSLSLGCPVHLVEECHTSESARERYVAEVPARGWRRLVPRSLRSPENPYDDFVAVILAERWWKTRRENDRPV